MYDAMEIIWKLSQSGLIICCYLRRVKISWITAYTENPSLQHVGAIKRLLRYLKGTRNLTIKYTAQSLQDRNLFYGYADTAYMSCTIFRSDLALTSPTFRVTLSHCHNTPPHSHFGHSIIFTLLRSICLLHPLHDLCHHSRFCGKQLSFVIFHSCGWQ